MKTLVHRAQEGAAMPFDLDALKAHLRVDFEDDDAEIARIGQAAAAELEQFAQLALLRQTIRVTRFDPDPAEYGLRLPIGPLAEGDAPTVTIDGAAFTDFDFEPGNRPYVRWLASYHELAPSRMTITYLAGFGPAATDIPPDLAQALMDQAGMLYDNRSPVDRKSLTTSPHMARVGARYRGVAV